VLVSLLPSSSVTLVLTETVLVLVLLKLQAVMTQITTAIRMIARIFFIFIASDGRLLVQARKPSSKGAVQPRAVFIGTIGMARFFIDCPHSLRASRIAL
jgi:hypothetical protein